MEIRFSESRYLTPRLLAADGASSRRVAGVIDPGAGEAPRFVDAIDFDGQVCRYRVEAAGADPDGWLGESEAGEYRTFSALIIDRLRTIDADVEPLLHRFPGGPPSRALTRAFRRLRGGRTLSVLDTAITAGGRLWLRADCRGTDGGEPVDAWRLLADAGDVFGAGWLEASRIVPARRRVA